MLAVVLLAALWAPAAVFAQEAQPGKEQPASQEQPAGEEPAQGASAAGKEALPEIDVWEESEEGKDDVFVPTESISADASIAFPSDI